MAGNVMGGKRAAETNRKRHGDDFYVRLGAMGGSTPTSKPKGFAYLKANGMEDRISAAGMKGGRIGRRGK